jgi:membrane-associated protease RseP (regulator of RpoE activity)
VRVAEVQPGSGADLAGLRPGDVIVAVEGAPVRTIVQLRERLGAFAPGEAVRVTVLRDGDRAALRVTLSSPPQRVAPAVPPPATSPAVPQRRGVQPGGAQPGGAAGANFPPAVLEQLADLVADRLAARAAAATDAAAPEAAAAAATPGAAEPGASEAPLTAVFGRIASIDGDSVRLTGSLGGVTLALTDRTVRIGFKDAEAGDLVTAVVHDGVVQMLIVVG